MADLVSELLKDATVSVELAGLPPLTVRLDSQQPSALVSALRPRITIVKGGVSLAVIEPYGSPREGPPTAALLLGGFGLLFAGLLFFAVR